MQQFYLVITKMDNNWTKSERKKKMNFYLFTFSLMLYKFNNLQHNMSSLNVFAIVRNVGSFLKRPFELVGFFQYWVEYTSVVSFPYSFNVLFIFYHNSVVPLYVCHFSRTIPNIWNVFFIIKLCSKSFMLSASYKSIYIFTQF